MKKNRLIDIIVIASIVVIGLGLVAVFLLSKKPGSTVIVSVDGRETARYGLDEEVDEMIQGVGGSNRLIIRGGEAWIEDADCPDRLCVKQGRISHTNESIICLPHRISIRVTGGTDEAPDAVTSDAGAERVSDRPVCGEVAA